MPTKWICQMNIAYHLTPFSDASELRLILLEEGRVELYVTALGHDSETKQDHASKTFKTTICKETEDSSNVNSHIYDSSKQGVRIILNIIQ